ncbi:hypothetical protein, partial [Fodinicurvata sp. EGI_FJ10296]|uniref:hypothetical protein n=1 Tax=Fodinicurvata sp. EGI_FJ10296 TaxID=3231908 RepID=UPI003456D7E0
MQQFKTVARSILVTLFRRKWGRVLVRQLPQINGRLDPLQLQILRFSRNFTGDDIERQKIDVRISEIEHSSPLSSGGAEAASKASELLHGAALERLSKIIAEVRDARDEADVEQVVARIPLSELRRLSDALLSNLYEHFSFRPELFTAYRVAAETHEDAKLIWTAFELAPTLGDALKILGIGSDFVAYRSGSEASYVEVSEHAQALDFIFVDNKIELKFAESLCRRFVPEAKVYFGHRVKPSAELDWQIRSVAKDWQPIIEGNLAYYTKGETELDRDFLEYWNVAKEAVASLFCSDDRSVGPLIGFGKVGADALTFLLEDRAYLKFREFYSWKIAMKKVDASSASKTVLIMSKRAALISALGYCGLLDGKKLTCLVWGVEKPDISAIAGHPKSESGGLTSEQVESFVYAYLAQLEPWDISNAASLNQCQECTSSANCDHNIDNLNSPTKYTFVTTSAYENYIDFAIDIASKFGADHSTIIDINPNGIRCGAEARASAKNISYKCMHHVYPIASLSKWEQGLAQTVNQSLTNALVQSGLSSHILTYLLIESDSLLDLSAQFVRLCGQVECLREHFEKWRPPIAKKDAATPSGHPYDLLMKLYNQPGEIERADSASVEATHPDLPIIVLMPGRTPANYLMAKYISQAFFVDIQFFINSESFRY